MRRASRSIGVATALALVASSALALGFGHLRNATVLGSPLDFTVPLRFEAGEFVSAECVNVDVLSGENKLAPGNVRVTLDASGNPEAPLLHLRSSALIDEPIVTIVVGVGCPVRLSRTFVALIDPPLVNLAQSAPSVAATPAQAAPGAPPSDVTAESPPARRAAAPKPASEASAPPARRPRPPRAVVRAPVERSASAARRSAETPRARNVAKAPASSGPRLRLDAPTLPLPASTPAASAPAVAAAPAAASAASSVEVVAGAPAQPAIAASATTVASDAALAAERERLRVLEDSLAKLKADSERVQGSVAALQSRLREAETGRYANGLVYALMALVAGLAFALAFVLWWARQRERERAAWWAAAAEQAAAGGAAVAPMQPPRTAATSDPAQESLAPRTWRHTVEIPELGGDDVPRRAVSAEELIDLEQQAEFFLTLGQDEAAVELLLNHIATVGGISPLPYLKLMEIHRQRGDRDAYERAREQFNQRFNAYAPGFDDRGAPAGSLEDDADVMARLQAAWPTPARAMGVLEPLLFRQGAREAVFDLAAYREVLFLYEVARDLAEHDSRPTAVDVELPLAEAAQPAGAPGYPIYTTMPIPPGSAAAARPLHLDLDLGPDTEPEKPNERSERYEGADFTFSGPAPLAGSKRPK